ncbi:interleukin-9 receptor-like [Engystomops pustulosus]|uniref:interleukin-9 receptor-like n=1 Tax=Engystomops pustulosus TaxID=76066 RepID=UPI003AFB4362
MRRNVGKLFMLFGIHLVLCDDADMCPPIPKSNVDCYTNYIDRITCNWLKESYSGNGPFVLTLTDIFHGYDGETITCDLVSSPQNNIFTCNMTHNYPSNMEIYEVSLEDQSSDTIIETIQPFKPCGNIKLDPPSDLSYNFTGTEYNITWRGVCNFIFSEVHYQVQLKKQASGQELLKNQVGDTYMVFQASEFDEGFNYIRIRCRPEDQEDYKSHWSNWSPQLKIEKKDETHKQNVVHIITIVTLLTLTLILLFLALRSNLYVRMHVSALKKIPTAADYFYPLYHIHNGNFQDWTKYSNKCKEKRKGREPGIPQDTDLYSTTVLQVQKDAISAVKLESPMSKEDISVTHATDDPTSWSASLVDPEISFNGMYPVFFSGLPGLSDDIMDEPDTVCSLDGPTDYFSYNGNYIANSQEIAE